ncbi:MAG: hypothetical protein Q9M36_05585 [Sulfurovum sp.]|nr:hypothetical protein [Sulfurovum sp.]
MLKLHNDTDVTLAYSIFSGIKRNGRVPIEDLYSLYEHIAKQRGISEPMSFSVYTTALVVALKEDALLLDFVYAFNSSKILF